jgi:hypothetical protein
LKIALPTIALNSVKNCTEDRQGLLNELQAALHCIVYYEKNASNADKDFTLYASAKDCIKYCRRLHAAVDRWYSIARGIEELFI